MATTKKLLLMFGDGGSPQKFEEYCTINTSREFTLEASTVDSQVPNCDAPDAPSWIQRSIDTLSAGISGAGTMDPITWGRLRDRMLAGEPIDVRIRISQGPLQGGGRFQGSFVITKLSASREGKGLVSGDVALASDGEIIWSDATA